MVIVLLVGDVALAFSSDYSLVQNGSLEWYDYINLSESGAAMQETEPKIAADGYGAVHILWTGRSEGSPAIYYATYREDVRGPVDVIVGDNALVAAVAVDEAAYLHVIWMGMNQIYHSRVFVMDALLVRAWEAPRLLGDGVASASSFAADIVVDNQNVLHVVYGASRSADVFTVRSEDGGVSWTTPQQIDDVGAIHVTEAASEVRIAYDRAADVLHVTWVARETPRGWPGTRLFYSRSEDGGLSWSAPLLVDEARSGEYAEDRGPFFPTVAVRVKDEVHLTWAGAPRGDRWHQWSTDGGVTWSAKSPMSVFNETARGMGIPGTTGFTDMVVDSAGQLYAVTTLGDSGAPRSARWINGVWDERSDSPYAGPDCEDPRVVVTVGNRLHLVCVEQVSAQLNDIWYVIAHTNSPSLPVEPLPTPEIAVPVATEEVTVLPTPTPDALPVSFAAASVESAAVGKPLVIGIAPVLFVMLGIVLYHLGQSRR